MRTITLATNEYDLDKGGRAGHVLIFEGAFTMEPELKKGVHKQFGCCIDEDFLTAISYEKCAKIFGRRPKPGHTLVLEVRTKKV